MCLVYLSNLAQGVLQMKPTAEHHSGKPLNYPKRSYNRTNQNIKKLLEANGIIWSVEKAMQSQKIESLRTLDDSGETLDFMKIDLLSLYNHKKD